MCIFAELSALGEELDVDAAPAYLSAIPSTEPGQADYQPQAAQPLYN